MLKLMYITNQPEVALIAEASGVDRIFVDMEYIGKSDRQGGMDTVQSHHTPKDVKKMKEILSKAKVVARCNPIHEETDKYCSSKQEIDEIIEAGADIIMLPYFKTVEEVKEFIRLVDGRAKTLPLVETPEAVDCINDILELDGIDEIFIGLNDLSLGYGMKFMFQLLADGTVEKLCNKFRARGVPYGFGGIAALGKGLLPAERVIAEHHRLGSTSAILSRSFCNTLVITDLNEIKKIFDSGMKEIIAFQKDCENGKIDFKENLTELKIAVKKVLEKIG
ncbi:MAG: aldolase [Clostridia bacterium]|nr:aldolase [Clostridia bacterium]